MLIAPLLFMLTCLLIILNLVLYCFNIRHLPTIAKLSVGGLLAFLAETPFIYLFFHVYHTTAFGTLQQFLIQAVLIGILGLYSFFGSTTDKTSNVLHADKLSLVVDKLKGNDLSLKFKISIMLGVLLMGCLIALAGFLLLGLFIGFTPLAATYIQPIIDKYQTLLLIKLRIIKN